ncbi:hypothetical protein GGR88_001201 [Sphingomonas jejuensis]|uniref:Exopolysaccharide biosynthesis protein n=1 Tax=Sphingomonas jejuensis TaxID=904715 RepID=A0ABX0XLI8_9SPHN|nr:exopolysaccharide biosynthesis protein [Sphingomonas jejuensis]NJC33727.1 hypothetical protein [Sphingomonas jejuensis]
MAGDQQDGGVGDILDRLKEAGEKQDRMTIGTLRDEMGQRSYGPFLLVPALIEISPIGGIPGVPTALAAIIILFAAQMLMGRKSFWLPGFVERRSLSGRKLVKATEKLRGIGRWLDRWFHGRLRRLTEGPWVKVAAALSILLALTVPPLELLPFASTAPMAAIAMFGLALLVHDGALMIAGSLLSGVAVAVGLGSIGG